MARRRAAPPPNVAAARATVERQRGELGRLDPLAGLGYLREFQEELRTFDGISSYRDLLVDCWRADLVYLADYHALPACQRFAARLLEDLARRSRKLVLAVEVFRGRHQEVLDAWLAGRISEETLLRRSRYEEDWGYPWEGYRELLLRARDLRVPVAAADCDPRAGLRQIRKRDRTIAAKITSIFQEDPERRVLAFIGESHLASTHLPARVRETLHSVDLEKRDVVVAQNADDIYWRLLEEGEESFEVVRLRPRRYCVFNATPLEKYEAYRQVLDRWQRPGPSGEADLQPAVYRIVDTILRFLGVDKHRVCLEEEGICLLFLVDAYPEVYGPDRAADLPDLLEALPRQKVREAQRRLRERGACYVREANCLFVARFELACVAEEAARFVNAALTRRAFRRRPRGRTRAERFFEHVLHEAMAYLGSKVLVPTRDYREETGAFRTVRAPCPPLGGAGAPAARGLLRRARARILAGPAGGPIPEAFARDLERAGVRARRLLARELGCAFGHRLWEAFHAGEISPREILALFQQSFPGPRDAYRAYLDLAVRVGSA